MVLTYELNVMKNLLIIFISLTGLACSNSAEHRTNSPELEVEHEITFNEEKWKTKTGEEYPYRNYMLEDLMSSEEFRSLKANEILNTLGQPDYYRDDSSYLYYRIKESRLGFWTLHTKTLVIKLAEDSTITWMKIHE